MEAIVSLISSLGFAVWKCRAILGILAQAELGSDLYYRKIYADVFCVSPSVV